VIRRIINPIRSNQQFSNLIIYGIGQGFNLITPLLVVPFIVSRCGVENYGKISIGMAISFFLMVFIDYGSDIIGVKEAAVNRENKPQLEHIFVTTFGAKFILLLITLFATSLLFYFLPFFNTEKEMFFLGFPILIAQFINPSWFLQGLEDFTKITILNIASKLIYLFCIFCFIEQKSDYVFINLFWGAGTLIANGATFLYVVKANNYRFKNAKSEDIMALLKANFSIFSSQIFVSLQMYGPIMLIGFFGNNLMAGQYRIVEQIIVIFKTYIYLFFNFVYPRVCYLIETNLKKGIDFWTTYNGLNFIFIISSMGIINLFSEQIVSYFTQTNIVEVAGYLRIGTLIPLLLALSIPLKQLVLGFNHQRFYIRVTMLMVVLNLISIIIVIPIYGTKGVFISLIVAELATLAVYYQNIKGKANFKKLF